MITQWNQRADSVETSLSFWKEDCSRISKIIYRAECVPFRDFWIIFCTLPIGQSGCVWFCIQLRISCCPKQSCIADDKFITYYIPKDVLYCRNRLWDDKYDLCRWLRDRRTLFVPIIISTNYQIGHLAPSGPTESDGLYLTHTTPLNCLVRFLPDFFCSSFFRFCFSPYFLISSLILLEKNLFSAYLRGSHGLSTQREQRTKPRGMKDLQLEAGT